MDKKRVIICGAGTSLNEGISQGLWDKIKNEETWSLNSIYKIMPYLPKREIFVDQSFFKHEITNLQKLHEQGVQIISKFNKKYTYLPIIMYFATREMDKVSDNTLFYGRMGLVGLFGISLAIKEEYEQIYLLGYDWGGKDAQDTCFDGKTEVFTNEGWKYLKELKGNELILTRKENDETEWSKILNKQEFFYEGEMYSIQRRGIDLLITPDHSIYLIPAKWAEIKKESCHPIFKKISELNEINYFTNYYNIPKNFKWKGEKKEFFILPSIEKGLNQYKKIQTGETKIPMEIWLKFFGLFISEGHCQYKHYKSGWSYFIKIFQEKHNNEVKYLSMEKILKEFSFHFFKIKKGWGCRSKQLANYLKQFGKAPDKFIPKEIKNLNTNNLKILLYYLNMGDGYLTELNQFQYTTTSKQLADDVQEIAYKCGYNAEIYFRKKKRKKFI